MSENTVRHLISICGTLIAFLAWWAGYVSGGHAWWWTAFAVFIIYAVIYKMLEA